MAQRFNKGYTGQMTYPVTNVSSLTTPSRLHSPMAGVAHDLPVPTMPGDPGFQAELDEVTNVRMHVLAGRWPAEFLAKYHPRANFDPETVPPPIANAVVFKGNNPRTGKLVITGAQASHIVHMDAPMDLAMECLAWLRTQNVRLRDPQPAGHTPFLNNVPNLHAEINDHVRTAMRKAFEVKYFYGRPRPEEVFANGGCPTNLYTHYNEGCPNHPAYPAGHGAAAAAAQVLLDRFDLNQAQIDVIVDSAYCWSMFRTFAGVHYANDNLAGLVVGGFGWFNSAGEWVI